MELGYLNVQVNAIAPGIIKTGFSQVLWQTPQIADPVLKGLASGRFGKKVSREPQKTSFGRLRTGSFGRLRTGSFGRLRTGSFAD